MCRDGDTHLFELEAAHKRLQSLPWPVYCLPGNHDIGGRYHVDNPASVSAASVVNYRSVFGDDYYAFMHRGTRFLCLDSMIMGSGLAAESEQWQWLAEQAQDSTVPTMVLMHSLPCIDEPGKPHNSFSEDFKSWYATVPERDQLRLADFFNAINVLSVSVGHIHVFEDRLVQGKRRVLCPSTAFLGDPPYLPDAQRGMGFLQWTMDGSGAQVQVHALERESTLSGYGPGGNIPVAERDYSVAWESDVHDGVTYGD